MANRTFRLDDRPSLMCLPDDILYMITDQVMPVDNICGPPKYPRPDKAWSNLSSLSSVNRRMRMLCGSKLFRAVTIGPRWDWLQAVRGISSMARSRSAIEHTRTFTIDIDVSGSKDPRLSSCFTIGLASVLLSLEKLDKLTFLLPEIDTVRFRRTFESVALSLPAVRSLVVGPYTYWIIDMCPNVQSIATRDWHWAHENHYGSYLNQPHFDLIRAASQAEELQHFQVQDWWRPDRLIAVLNAIPDISSLGLPRGLFRRGEVQSVLPILARFSNLRCLVLEQAADLAWADGITAARWPVNDIEAHRGGAQEKAAELVFAQCVHLNEMWVGAHAKAVPSRSENGMVCEVFWSFGHNGPPAHIPQKRKQLLQVREKTEVRKVQAPIGRVHHEYTRVDRS